MTEVVILAGAEELVGEKCSFERGGVDGWAMLCGDHGNQGEVGEVKKECLVSVAAAAAAAAVATINMGEEEGIGVESVDVFSAKEC